MAKPGSAPTEWASDANYSSGPATGNPTKAGLAGAAAQGIIAGVSIKSEPLNAVLNEYYQFVAWVYDGSSAGTADAHIVETDGTGKATLRSLEVDASTDTGFALEVSGAPTTGSTALAQVSYTGSVANYPVVYSICGGTGTGTQHAFRGQYQSSSTGGACYYGNAITQAVGVFVAECSNNDTPGFALSEFPTAAGDFRWSDRTADSTTTEDGDMWLALSMATPDHDDPLRFYDASTGVEYVHSSDTPHLLTSEARDSTDAILSRTISSYTSMVDRQYYARGSDTIRVRAGLSISSDGSGEAEIRLTVNGVVVDVRAWDGTQYFPSGSAGEDFDMIMCADVSEAAVSASGLTTVALQWRETSTGTIYSARCHIEVYRGFNQD